MNKCKKSNKEKNLNRFFKPVNCFSSYIFTDIDSLPSCLTLYTRLFF